MARPGQGRDNDFYGKKGPRYLSVPGGGDPGVSGQQAQSEVKSEEILLGNNLSLGSPGSSVTLQRPPRGGSELQVSQVWGFPSQAVIASPLSRRQPGGRRSSQTRRSGISPHYPGKPVRVTGETNKTVNYKTFYLYILSCNVHQHNISSST